MHDDVPSARHERASSRGAHASDEARASLQRGCPSPREGLASCRRGTPIPRRGIACIRVGLVVPRRGLALTHHLLKPRRYREDSRARPAFPLLACEEGVGGGVSRCGTTLTPDVVLRRSDSLSPTGSRCSTTSVPTMSPSASMASRTAAHARAEPRAMA
jgi:hypothetical protein